ncbi:acyltransferase [Candidatus Ventrimonas sp. KK005]
MLNLFLILLILILIIPRPLSETMKKLLPLWGSIVVVALIVFVVQRIEERKNSNDLIITALNEKNEASDGSEIWLVDVIVDGKHCQPSDYFGEVWIKKGNALIWRSYDQKQEMPDSISAHFEPGSSVKLIFQTNRWRGKAQIICGNYKNIADFYVDTDSSKATETYTITIPEISTGKLLITKTGFIIVLFASLLLLNLIYYAGYYIAKGYFPPTKKIDNRELWFDILKIVSSIMIILIHSSGQIYESSYTTNPQLWLKTLWINAIPRFAVPCFLMITGALVMEKTYDFGKKLTQKIGQLLIPLIAWSVIYILAKKLLWNHSEDLIKEILKIPFKNQDGSLWYIYQLIWLYLGLPFWQILYHQLDEQMRWCFVIFCLGIPGLLTMFGELSLLNVPDYLPFASIQAMPCYVGLLFLGKLWYDQILQKQVKTLFFQGVLLSGIGLGIMVLSSIYVGNKSGQAVHMFFSEVRIPAIFYGSGIFLIFGSLKNTFQKFSNFTKKIIVSLSTVSLGIYLSHCLIIWIWPDMTIGTIWIWKDSGSLLQLIICVGIYYGIAAVGCLMASHLPGLKRLVM